MTDVSLLAVSLTCQYEWASQLELCHVIHSTLGMGHETQVRATTMVTKFQFKILMCSNIVYIWLKKPYTSSITRVWMHCAHYINNFFFFSLLVSNVEGLSEVANHSEVHRICHQRDETVFFCASTGELRKEIHISCCFENHFLLLKLILWFWKFCQKWSERASRRVKKAGRQVDINALNSRILVMREMWPSIHMKWPLLKEVIHRYWNY